MNKTLESVLASELNVGDIVHTHGMRVLLDHEPIVFSTTSMHGPGYSFNGLVLNIDEIDDPFLLSQTHVWEGGERTGERRWTVQSNDLRSWAREVRS